jgi:ribosomal protein S18 acetylase RimI-like enzyme
VSHELQSVLEYGLEPTVELLNQGFADYVVPIHIDLATVMHVMSQESIDVSSSRVVSRKGHPVGVALIGRRGWTSRLAGMAVVPQARGVGVGRWLLSRLLEEARGRGERAMVLEVIEGNEPAQALYSSCGFQTVRRLVSYSGSPVAGPAGAEATLAEVDLREMARLVSAYGLPGLPWQISGESLAHFGPPNVAYQLDGAYVALSNPQAEQLAVRSLLVLPEARGRGRATQLLRAMVARYPHKTWRVPPLCPEEIGGLFEKLGFERGSLSQLQMRIEWG